MPVRFNSPPGWPQPRAGWTPPVGWSPDPSWPPLPAGWELFVDDSPLAPATATPQPAPRVDPIPLAAAVATPQIESTSRRRLLWPVIAIVALLFGVGIGAAAKSKSTPVAATSNRPQRPLQSPLPPYQVQP
jgi:hypothetical protein